MQRPKKQSMNNELTHSGSRWWKVDFHVHTPKSHDYGRGDAQISNGTTPEIWLKYAMEVKLDCVVVADHNSGEFIDTLKAAYETLQADRPEWFPPLTIFPGVEITVSQTNDSIHLLGVFDPEVSSDNITAVLGKCGITRGFGNPEISTSKSFEEVVNAIRESNGIAIAAHIDGPKGLLHNKTTLNHVLKHSLSKLSAAEFCNHDEFKASANDELKKAVSRLAVLAGSDAHRPEEIGKHSTWIKMSKPSVEGLQLALMDHEFCVKNQTDNPNHVPDIYLSSLQITAMRHCGRIPGKPYKMQFHPNFNAVIGGRGTGKSTVLNAIRLAARRERELDEITRLKDNLNEFSSNEPKKGVMLNESELLLCINRRGRDYRMRWRYDGSGQVLEEKNGNDWQSCDAPGDLRERFPVSIYSQGQINELASNPKGLLEILDRSPEVNHSEWQHRWESAKSQFLQLRQQQRQMERQLAREQSIKTRLQDVEIDIKQYEEKGHGEILKNYQRRTQQLHAMPPEYNFDNLADRIKELAEDTVMHDFASHLFLPADDPTTTEVTSIYNLTASELKEIQNKLFELTDKVDEISANRKRKLEASQWYQSVQQAIQDYKTIVKEYQDKNSQFDFSVYGQWVQERSQLQREKANMESLRQEYKTVQNQLNQTYSTLLSLRKELFDSRNTFIQKVIGANPYVRMELVPFGDVSTIESEYRSLLGLDDSSFKTSILDPDEKRGLLWQLFNWENDSVSESELVSLIYKVKKTTSDIASGGNTSNVPDYIHGSFKKRLQQNNEKNPANLDQLLCSWWPEDLLRVKYARDSQMRKFEDLEKGSAGQKASAILAFILSHGTEPLIIDQPEDDLDNALIYDLVVRQIHNNKNQRQLIIVTHNPNIVVNGDAELVHILHFISGQVQLSAQGGLEEKHIRGQICTIMEGGREAFEKRYKRITFEL